MVSWLGAVQAQEYHVAKWAVGQRTTSLEDVDVEQAFNDGDILRTHVLRPTWHFVARDDLRWLMALSGPRLQQTNASMYRKVGLDAPELRRSTLAIEKALRDGACLTRNELRLHLERARVAVKDSIRCAYVLMYAELASLICSGPRKGAQFTYALFDRRVPAAAPISRDEALGELTRRYFQSRRPATLHDFVWWSGLTMADARRGVDISRVDVGATTGRAGKSGIVAHLLPIYDEYPLSYKDRSAAMPPDGLKLRASARANITFTNAVVIDGVIAGHWKREVGDVAAITLYPLRAWSPAERRAVAAQAERYGRFLGVPAVVKYS